MYNFHIDLLKLEIHVGFGCLGVTRNVANMSSQIDRLF